MLYFNIKRRIRCLFFGFFFVGFVFGVFFVDVLVVGIGFGFVEGFVGIVFDVFGEVVFGDFGEVRSKRGIKIESGGNGFDGFVGLLVFGGVGFFDFVGFVGEDD